MFAKTPSCQEEELIGRYIASDVIDEKTGQVLFEAGDEVTTKSLTQMEELGIKDLPVLGISVLGEESVTSHKRHQCFANCRWKIISWRFWRHCQFRGGNAGNAGIA